VAWVGTAILIALNAVLLFHALQAVLK